MKWQSHKLTTFATVFALTGHLVPSAFAAMGSVMPDVLESGTTVKHRTFTHWPPVYILAYFLVGPLVAYWFLPGFATFSWCLVGCLCHLAEDALSKSGVPILTPRSEPRGVGLYATGTITEAFTVVWIVAAAALVAASKGYLAGSWFWSEVTWMLSLLPRR